MITKGIVEEIITPYSIKVRIPTLDSVKTDIRSTPTEDLASATICSLPNSYNHVSIGDIVFIGFEDNDSSKPIILGHLFKDKASETLLSLKLNTLDVEGTTKLSKNTTIGDLNYNDLLIVKYIGKYLETLKGFDPTIKQYLMNEKGDIRWVRAIL